MESETRIDLQFLPSEKSSDNFETIPKKKTHLKNFSLHHHFQIDVKKETLNFLGANIAIRLQEMIFPPQIIAHTIPQNRNFW